MLLGSHLIVYAKIVSKSQFSLSFLYDKNYFVGLALTFKNLQMII
jgi:hypothetical protein